jgi:hypothetical protein
MSYKSDLVDPDLYMIGETALAIKVTYGKDQPAIWLPKSQIEFEPSRSITKGVRVTLPMWLAEKTGLTE